MWIFFRDDFPQYAFAMFCLNVWQHTSIREITFKVAILDVRIDEQVKGEVIWEYSILDLHTKPHTSHV